MSIPWILFSDAIVLKASGKDARRYLNNRLSNNLQSLNPGGATRAAALTAQGRVEGLFTIFAQPADVFYLVCDGGSRDEVAAALKRFIVADRVVVEEISAQCVFVHIAAVSEEAQQLLSPCKAELQMISARPRVAQQGVDCLVVGEAASRISAQLEAACGEPLNSAEYKLRRLSMGFASFPEEINGDIILTEAGMRDSVSFTKGCYVGQEVIERSDARGKLPRSLELLRLSGQAEVPPGAPVLSATGEALGKTVSCAVDTVNRTTFLFALLRTGKYGSAERVECSGLAGQVLSRECETKGAQGIDE